MQAVEQRWQGPGAGAGQGPAHAGGPLPPGSQSPLAAAMPSMPGRACLVANRTPSHTDGPCSAPSIRRIISLHPTCAPGCVLSLMPPAPPCVVCCLPCWPPVRGMPHSHSLSMRSHAQPTHPAQAWMLATPRLPAMKGPPPKLSHTPPHWRQLTRRAAGQPEPKPSADTLHAAPES